MSEQNPNLQADDNSAKAAHSNLERNESVLQETMDEFDPQNNSGDDATIDNEIDISVYEARIAELEGEVKQARETTARANAETYNAQKRMEQEADKSKRFALQKFAKEL